MAELVAISGASATGKTTILNYIKFNPKMTSHHSVEVVPDLFKSVWEDLVQKGHFNDFDDITRDPEYLCIFIQKVVEYYNDIIKKCKSSNADYVILDCCWLDVAVYAQVNMWYNNILKDIQTRMMRDILRHRDEISKIYITKDDEERRSTEKFKCPFKKYNLKYDRDLELTYYDFYTSLQKSVSLPSSDTIECVDFIVNDLKL